MDLPALRMQQSGKTLYLTRMTARQLISCAHTAEWDPYLGWDVERQGFQRAPIPQHYEAIGRFLTEWPNPFMPTAALLSAAESALGRLRFTSADGKSDTALGILRIPEGRQLLIVDYQHRLHGLRFAIDDLGASDVADFTLPVIIVADIPRYEEIRQFYLINSKQKRIHSSLALTLLQTLAPSMDRKELENFVGPGYRHRIRATPLTFKLAAQSKGPWAGRIAQPHDLPQPDAIIRLPSFVDSLAPVVSKRQTCSQLEDDALLELLKNFWSALAAMMPKAFERPSEFQIQRTVGVYAFHIVLAKGAYVYCESLGKFSQRAFEDVLAPAQRPYITERFWATKGRASVFVGSSGYRELANRIIDRIRKRPKR